MELIKKHGATGVLVAWLVWTNMRLDEVETKLYNCLGDTKKQSELNQKDPVKPVAILPKELIYG
jgi:hypothetical protein